MEPKGAGAGSTVKAAYTVGRFQPPTIGHARLIEAVRKAAGKGDAFVFVSKARDTKKNPLPSSLKVAALNEMFPSGVTFVDTALCDPPCGGPVAAHAYLLAKGYTDITLVAGSDRAPDFNEKADMWKAGLAKDPPISPPRFVGLEREAQGKGVAAMSGTKARALAKAGDKAGFTDAVRVGSISDTTIHALYRVIQDPLSMEERKGGRRTRRQKGGKRIGEGATAFIIDPPVPCADGRTREGKYVSRVVPKEDFLEEEKEELQKWREYHTSVIRKLAEIDPDQKYFYYPDLSCTPGELTEENKADRVTPGMRIELFRYAPGGTIRGKSLTPEQKAHVDKAVQLLRENRIRHGDLQNRENIVIADDGLPRIIDWDTARVVTPSASGPAGAGASGTGGRRTRRNKASGRALSRRGLRSRSGS